MEYIKNNKKIRIMKIRTKLIITFFFLSTIPLLIIGFMSYSISSNAIQDKIENYSAQVMSEVSNNLTINLTRFESLCEEIEMNDDIQKGLSKYKSSSYIEKHEIEDKIYLKFIEKMRLSSFGASSEIVSINFLIGENIIIGAGQNFYKKDQLINVSNLSNYLNYKYSYGLIKDLNNNYNIVIKKNVKNHITGEAIGTIILTFKESFISELCKNLDMKGNAEVFIIDSKGITISSSNHSKIPIGKVYSEKSMIETLNQFKKTGKMSFSININGEKKLVAYNFIKNYDWAIVSTIPYSYLQKESKYMIKSIIIIGLITTVGMTIVIILVINLYVKAPINEISAISHYLADGNLKINFNDNSKDEIGEMSKDLNNFLKKLVEIIDNASAVKLNIDDTADNLNLGNKALVDKITNQSASLEQIAATMEEIKGNVSNNFNKITEMYSITKEAERKITYMELSSKNLNNSILEIEKSSHSIEEIVNFVQNISFQTKLLAINSSVAAARAGEQGKEFSEIAMGIRELSKMSSNSVTEIKIKIDENESNIIKGKKIIEETLETIEKVSNITKEIYRLIQEVSTESNEEKNAIMQINVSVNEISEITQNISMMAQDVSKIATFLKKETKYLSEIFNFFNKH